MFCVPPPKVLSHNKWLLIERGISRGAKASRNQLGESWGGGGAAQHFPPHHCISLIFLFMAAFCFIAIKTHTATSMAEYIIRDNLNLCSQDIVAHICLKLLFKQGFLHLNNLLNQPQKSTVLMTFVVTRFYT